MLQLQKHGLRNLVQNLTLFKKLHLSQVNISSTIPHALANLSSLTSLRLRECGLHGEFPKKILQLPSLQFLSLRYNPNLNIYFPEFQETSPLKVLYLAGTSYSGELPASMGKLSSLSELDISSCNFTGLVPSSLGHLTQLSYLDLSYNFFSGPIPSFLANLTTLTYLSLTSNNFSAGTLAWLGEQTKLTILYLDQINLNGEIPSSLVNMSELTILNLSKNQLIGQIPSWLMNLTQLTELYLQENKLEGPIPSSLFELVNLQYLYLHSNYLTGTVELHMLSNLKNLTDLQLSYNRISLLSYTSTNATLPKFKLLGLASCNLTEFPDFLQNQQELEVLILSTNKIHGPIPKWMWNISKETLEALFLSNNFLSGFSQVPDVLPWSRMSILELSSNMLQGSLPVPPSSTVEYSVSRNRLAGEIPSLICNLTSLSLLDLSGNNLSGSIPQCFTKLSSSLSILNLRRNNLNGPIPQTCTNTSNLRMIDLSENQLQGQIPKSLASCMMLEELVLGNNLINDIFPFWLGSLPRLQVLILRFNRFHGAIGSPKTNFEFSKLRIIDLSYNGFTGNLPSEYLKNWDAMRIVDAENLTYIQVDEEFEVPQYSWEEPYPFSTTMTNKGMTREYELIPDILIAIDLSSNRFHGEIPESIGNPNGLRWLNLSNNALIGAIPTSLANLTLLEALDLSQNKLSREIPQQLVQLTFLAFFNVSHNHLTGPIPQGKQFATFSRASFDGNPGLCGSPLSRACGSSEQSPPTPSSSKQGSTSEFDWKFVLMGCGSGLVIGVSIGYCLTSWKHEWFVKTFGKQHTKWTRKERRGHRG
ncbi:receptor-like protein 7 isoform X2 [Vitis vinifera]|nr:receptor-like protein 7 isoform X2 [Vitis vinifera]